MFREREAAARELVDGVRERGGRAWAGQCDVGDEAAVGAFFEQAAAELGPADILGNNADIARDAHVMFHDRTRWEEVLQINLDAAYFCVRAVVRGMLLRRWGRIINVSSPSARLPLAGQVSYAPALRRPGGLRGVEGGAQGADARGLARSRREGRARQRRLAGADRNRNARDDAGVGARRTPEGFADRPHRPAL